MESIIREINNIEINYDYEVMASWIDDEDTIDININPGAIAGRFHLFATKVTPKKLAVAVSQCIFDEFLCSVINAYSKCEKNGDKCIPRRITVKSMKSIEYLNY